MGDAVGQRDLRIAPALHGDPGGGPAQRILAVGADRELRVDGVAVDRANDDAVDRGCRPRPHRPGCRCRFGMSAARASSAAIRWRFSIFQAKASSPISCASKRASGARHSRLRGVDDPQGRERRGMLTARLPDPERLERRDRACEQGRGAVVGGRLRARPARRSNPAEASASAAVRPDGPPPTTAPLLTCDARSSPAILSEPLSTGPETILPV